MEEKLIKKIKNIRSQYLFKYINTIELPLNSRIDSIACINNYLVMSDRGEQQNQPFVNGKILLYNIKTCQFERNLVENIRTFRGIFVSVIEKTDEIIYAGSNEEGFPALYKCSINDPCPIEFVQNFRGNKTNNFLIRTWNDSVFFADLFHHVLRKYSNNGELIAECETWKQGYEYPMIIETIDEENLFIYFGQALERKTYPAYAKGLDLKLNHFARWNSRENKLYSFEIALNNKKKCIYSVRTKNGEYFIAQGQRLLKLNNEFKVIFNVNNINENLKNIDKKDSLKKKITNPIVGYADKKLYVIDCLCATSNNMYVFNVG